MDLLLDTNILIDHFGNRPGFAHSAHKVMALGVFGDATLWVTSNALIDAFYLLRKAIDPHHVQKAFAKSLPHLHVCSAGQEDLAQALEQSWPDLEDCLVSVCAEKVHADYIVTRDARGFTRARTATISPEELLQKMACERGLRYDYLSS